MKMVIVGNKVDLEGERQVPRRRGEKVRKMNRARAFLRLVFVLQKSLN